MPSLAGVSWVAPSVCVGGRQSSRWRRPATCAARRNRPRRSLCSLRMSSLQEPLPSGLSDERLREIVSELKLAPQDESISLNFATSLLSSFRLGEEEVDELASDVFRQLRARGVLKWFGAFESSEPPTVLKSVSVEEFSKKTGIPISALAPKQSTVRLWQLGGVGAAISIFLVARIYHVDMYAQALALGGIGAFFLDQVALRGALFESLYRAVLPQYGEKVLRHEAGHFLIAYLLGCPVRGYIVDAWEAVKRGIPGQAGTVFTDPRLQHELKSNKLTQKTVDRYVTVVMGGVAAEALHYGQAEGGQNDEFTLISMLSNLRPAWRPDRIIEEARWGAQTAILLLQQQKAAYEALVTAMREKRTLGECIEVIERSITPLSLSSPPSAPRAAPAAKSEEEDVEAAEQRRRRSWNSDDLSQEEREARMAARLDEISNRLRELDAEK